VGGLLTERANWSWIFFINVPVGVIGVLAARAFIDETKDTSREQRLDLPGLIASGVGLFALTYALIETNTHAWGSTRVLALLALAALALATFVALELANGYRCSTLRCSAIRPLPGRTRRWHSSASHSMRQVGGSLEVAVMGTVVATQVSVGQLDPRYPAQFVDGYHRALHVGAVLLLAGAVLAVLTVGRKRSEPQPSAEPEQLLPSTRLEEAA